MFKYSCKNAMKTITSHLHKKKNSGTLDKKIITEETEENTYKSKADIESSLKP